ncbi:MAG TPA: hypothetical protein VFM18_18010 [Methanosarcina sp.]|nr:hypothetical protein [Methanosarcina sp.]
METTLPFEIEGLKLYGYNVSITQCCDHSEQVDHSDEPYDYSWSESYSNYFDRITKTDEYPDVVSMHDFKAGDQAYLVWAEWSSGDSFGHGDRNNVEALGVFMHKHDAENFAQVLRETRSNKSESGNFSWTSSEGQIVETGCLPWCGYFETLDNINVELVSVGE